MELFHIPSRVWVTASFIAGRCEYGSQSTSRGPGSLRRATSVIARYRIGADACSSSQLTGNESGSGEGVVIVGDNSAAVPGAVTNGARYVGAGLRRRRAHEPPIARKNSTFSR